MFAIDAPTAKRLAGYADDWVARTAAEHGDNRDPTVHAATDAADHEAFVQLLRPVKFSG